MLRDHAQPDLLMTQECRALPPEAFACTTGLWSEARSGKWGTGLYSVDRRIKPINVPGFDGWVVGGAVVVPSWLSRKHVRAFSVHCPAGTAGYVRTMHQLIDALHTVRKSSDIVLGGDFNVAVGFRGDGEAVKMGRPERSVLQRLVTELELMPCWQTANPGVALAQTLRWSGNRAAPYHCDGIFVPRRWKNKLLSCDVLSGPAWDQLSDHNPVVAVFQKRVVS